MECDQVSTMLDNPLYGSVPKTHGWGKDQDHPQRDHLTIPDHTFATSKAADGDSDRPPVPTPRNRSFTCSDKPQPVTPTTMQKKPVVPSRSEGGMAHSRPPLPSKGRLGIPEPQNLKPRDYRDSSELPVKQRLPARPVQPLPQRDSKQNTPFSLLTGIQWPNKLRCKFFVFLQHFRKLPRWAVLWSEVRPGCTDGHPGLCSLFRKCTNKMLRPVIPLIELLEGISLHFGSCAYSPLCWELDEKTDTTLTLYAKYYAKCSYLSIKTSNNQHLYR